jgi:hypothetical protein
MPDNRHLGHFEGDETPPQLIEVFNFVQTRPAVRRMLNLIEPPSRKAIGPFS